MQDLIKRVEFLLADTYTLSLKVKNYHWHVTGQNFSSLHAFFETLYRDLDEAVDEIAERLRMLDCKVPGTLRGILGLSRLKEASGKEEAKDMVHALCEDYTQMATELKDLVALAEDVKDYGTTDCLVRRLGIHEKYRWMLKSMDVKSSPTC